MNQRFQLSHADTLKIIEVIQAELEKDDKGAAVAVTDEHGELIKKKTSGWRRWGPHCLTKPSSRKIGLLWNL